MPKLDKRYLAGGALLLLLAVIAVRWWGWETEI